VNKSYRLVHVPFEEAEDLYVVATSIEVPYKTMQALDMLVEDIDEMIAEEKNNE